MRTVILAGGQGTRLKPYTLTLPKPLVPLGGEMPVLEVIIRQLRRQGIMHATIAVSHLAHLIQAFFQDGCRWGMSIDYSVETEPLGTIGPLLLLEDLPENFLVMNGDVLCDLDFQDFFRWHCAAGNDVSVSVHRRQQLVDFGVIRYDAVGRVTDFVEKPVYDYDVSMGVYALNRRVLQQVPRGRAYGFDELMVDGLRAGLQLAAKPFHGYWLDMGRPDDYEAANDSFAELKTRLGIG